MTDTAASPVPNCHEHCDWPRCACWCGRGDGTWDHPEGGHHQYWGPNTASGAGNGYPVSTGSGAVKYHSNLRPLDPKGEGRRWTCIDCGAVAVGIPAQWGPCSGPDGPPCVWCGQTPTCAIDCDGVKVALAFAADVIDARNPATPDNTDGPA